MRDTPSSVVSGRQPATIQAKARPTAKRALLFTVLLLSVIGFTKLGYDWFTAGRFIETTDDAYVGGDVTVIAPKVAGFVSEITVGDNQPVHKGDLLIKLDDRDFQAALAKAMAAVNVQKATETNLDAQAELQIAIVAQAEAEVSAADAEIIRTEKDFNRFKSLVAAGAESVQKFDQADAAYKIAKDNGDKVRATLVAAQKQLGVIATQKSQTQAALNAAMAELDLAKLNLSYTELRAPVNGVVGNRSAQIGGYATVGSQLLSVIPSRGLWVDANFKEDQLASIHPGSPVTVTIDLMGRKKFHGHVASIAPATGSQFSLLPPENATGNFTKIVQRVAVRILFDDENATLDQLRPGLSVTAKVNTKF